jgi:hypothetical protein
MFRGNAFGRSELLDILGHDGALHIEIKGLRFRVERQGVERAREGLLFS